jgi:signal transduction histidine kinase
MNAFQLGAAALFLAAGTLRLARWRVTSDSHSGLLAAAMFVLSALAMPMGNLTAQVLHGNLQPSLGLAARALGTAVCLGLALRAMTVTDHRTPPNWPRTLLAAALTAVAGLAGMSALLAVAPSRVTALVLLHVVADLTLAFIWLTLGLAASRRDSRQPWAGRVAPLYASLGVVEVLNSLDQVQPGSWALPSAALLSSVAMITAHSAYVDLVESSRRAAALGHRPHRSESQLATALSGAVESRERPDDFDVSDVVGEIVRRRAAAGQEVRVRGGKGVAHARRGDLWLAVEKLLVNAHVYAASCPVTLHVVAIGPRIEVSVSDRGPGMSADVAYRAFEPGGSLHVARALMIRNGGDLELRSRIGGTTFVVTVPAALDQRTEPTVPAWDAVPLKA